MVDRIPVSLFLLSYIPVGELPSLRISLGIVGRLQSWTNSLRMFKMTRSVYYDYWPQISLHLFSCRFESFCLLLCISSPPRSSSFSHVESLYNFIIESKIIFIGCGWGGAIFDYTQGCMMTFVVSRHLCLHRPLPPDKSKTKQQH